MRLFVLMAWAAIGAAQALPSAFVVAGGVYSQTDSPKASQFVSGGKLVSGSTYVLTSFQLAGRQTRIYVEGCQRVAVSGIVSLWAYVGLAGSSSSGGVTAGGMLSVHLWKTGGFEAGIRTVQTANSSTIPRQLQAGLVWEFP
jgi:hypothetical protein